MESLDHWRRAYSIGVAVDEIKIMRVAMSLIFQERRAYAYDAYIHSEHYDPQISQDNETLRLKKYAQDVLNQKIPRTDETLGVFAKVAQSFRISGWDYENEILLV